MRVRAKAIMVAAVVLAATFSVPEAAGASAPACSARTKFGRVIELAPKGGAHAATKKHPGGWVRGRYMRVVDDGATEPYWKAYGKKHTRYFAKKPVVCLLLAGNRGQVLRRSSLKGLRKQVDKGTTSWQYGLVIKKNRVVRIVQLWHP